MFIFPLKWYVVLLYRFLNPSSLIHSASGDWSNCWYVMKLDPTKLMTFLKVRKKGKQEIFNNFINAIFFFFGWFAFNVSCYSYGPKKTHHTLSLVYKSNNSFYNDHQNLWWRYMSRLDQHKNAQRAVFFFLCF